jgi:2-polyprenyl-6-methoxyphenol hydroxylase-like FAD-dependent oxidoreductase
MASAIILGGGVAGMAASLALAKAGWHSRIFERAERLEPIGAALSLWPNATEGLRRLDVLDRVLPLGAPITTMLVADRRERPILARRAIDGTAIIITRANLQAALADALPAGALTLGKEAVAVEADASGVRVRFTDGAVEAADMLIDAGGLRSIAAEADCVSYRGYGGVVALSDPVEDGGLDGLAAEYWGWRERFGVFELPGDRRYWFYMRDQAVDAVPPTHAAIRARSAGWTPSIGRAITTTPPDRLIPFSIHARPAPRTLGEGRIIRVGDAAHAMEPNLGQGACQAIEDAVALEIVARAQSPDRMLTEFEALRLKRVAGIVRRAAEGKHGAHGALAAQWAMRNTLRLIPDRISDGLARSIQTLPA